jgi:arginine deiminase
VVIVLLNDDVWDLIYETTLKYDGISAGPHIRKYIEQNADIVKFDGGVFIAIDNEFDLYVVKEKQGKWRIRSTISNYLNNMADKYENLIVKIHEENHRSLRLAKFFNFKEIDRSNKKITLEYKNGLTN